ncbi:MAG: hypothetical protein K2P87_05900 [Lachnospiraceae bacterium]|nr:hypothetical protein [Lachnospiraceae bacterium]
MGTEADYRLVNDIIDHHGERVQNLKKYYPFFYLQATSLAQYHEGKYAHLDMGYISLALLRFFIEENNFNEQEVTLKQVQAFLAELLLRDFDLHLPEEEEKELTTYLFDKLRNDGKPFQFEYFDPADKKRKTARMKLVESGISGGNVVYSITADAIEFYLDTKEIREESKINIEQLLLEKMIRTKNFAGGIEVVRRMNSEVNRLRRRKKEVLMIMGYNVFEGVAALAEFNRTGVRWFKEEQRAFTRNKQLADAARQKAESSQVTDGQAFKEIFRLDKELQKAMANHGRLLADCMELQVRADEIIHKYKFSRLKNAFDFGSFLSKAKEQDDASCLGELVLPLLMPQIKKHFSLAQVENILLAPVPNEEKPQSFQDGCEEDYRFEDEIEEERIDGNYGAILKTLLDTLLERPRFDLAEFNEVLEDKYFDEIFKNSDYYSFLVQLCQKRLYDLEEIRKKQDTFLDGILARMLAGLPDTKYRGLRFGIELVSDIGGEDAQAGGLSHGEPGKGGAFCTSNVRFYRL